MIPCIFQYAVIQKAAPHIIHIEAKSDIFSGVPFFHPCVRIYGSIRVLPSSADTLCAFYTCLHNSLRVFRMTEAVFGQMFWGTCSARCRFIGRKSTEFINGIGQARWIYFMVIAQPDLQCSFMVSTKDRVFLSLQAS